MLEGALAGGDYYGALQLFRTQACRSFDAGGPVGVAEFRALVARGARALAAHGRVLEAADLGDLLVKNLASRAAEPVDAADVGAIEEIAACLAPGGTAPIGEDGSGVGSSASAGTGASASAASEAKAHAARVGFLQSALRWAGPAPRREGDREADEVESEEPPAPDSRRALLARLHLCCARACAAGGDEFLPDAQRHLCESLGAGAECGRLLHAWALRGYRSERDLFLARAALQMLSAGSLGDANAMRDEFLRLGGPLESPLAHFVKFLLLAAERDAQPLFLALVDKYRAALQGRDPDLLELAQIVGQRFFGVQPPRNPMQDMMASMLGLGGGGGGGGFPGLPGLMGNAQARLAASRSRTG